MIPGFAPEGGPALVLLRGGADAGLLSAFGATLAVAWLVPPLLPESPTIMERQLRVWAGLSLLAAPLLALGWLLAESADMAGSVAGTPAVLQDTLFGHLIAARLALLATAALAWAARRSWAATVLAGVALASQVGDDHAWAMDGVGWLVLSNGMHVLAAGAWLGGLVPLLLVVRAVPPAVALRASHRFSVLGSVCVLAIAITAAAQAMVLAGSWSGLVGQPYGWVLLSKLILLLVLVALAARNRLLLTPRLASGQGKAALVRSIAVETAVGLVVVFAAALLTSLPPGMAM